MSNELTQEQRDTFRLALASLNNCNSLEVADLDINEVLQDADIAITHDSLDDFFAHNGRRLNRRSERPAIAHECNATPLGNVYQWEDVQSRKGARRGTLYVMDFGAVRAAYFTGEV